MELAGLEITNRVEDDINTSLKLFLTRHYSFSVIIANSPRHYSPVLAVPLHCVGLPTASHSVCEEETILSLEQITDQRKTDFIKDISLSGILIKHVCERNIVTSN